MDNKRAKKTGIADMLLSMALTFTVLFFSPAEMYFANKAEFILGGREILLPMLICALVSALINAALLLFLRKKAKPVHTAVSVIELGLLMSFYVQMLLFNGKMLSIGSDQTVYLDDTKMVTVNFVLDLLIFFIPAAVFILSKHYKNNSLPEIIKSKMTAYISAAVIVMQLAGLVSVIAQNSRDLHILDYEYYLSYEPSVSYSKEGNILVILADRLDGDWFDLFLTEKPSLEQTFDGFTYYRNNVSNYLYTFPTIAYMLTAKKFDFDENYNGRYDFLKQAWENTTIPDELKKAGYDVDLLIDKNTTYASANDLEGRCDNIRKTDGFLSVNYKNVIKIMTDISMGKAMPYLFKPLFINKYKSSFSTDFVSYGSLPDDYMTKFVGPESDMGFYNYFKDHGINADRKNKKFMFVHLNAMHDVSREISELAPDFNGNVNIGSTAMGTFEILDQYFERMKAAGVYDNTTIIVLGDHGRPPDEINTGRSKELESPIITGLLVKPAFAPRGRFTYDNETELSNQNSSASILEFAGIETQDYGSSYMDIEKNEEHQERILQTFNLDTDTDELEKCVKYSITGDARDFSNWKIIEK